MGPLDLEAAQKEFDKKFNDKSGHKWDERSEPAKKGKYTFLEKNYEDDEDEAEDQVKEEDDQEKVESKLPRQTQRLMELIFNSNHFNAVLEQIGYNANKLPLGKLSKATLKTGFEHLNELASLIKHPSLAQNKYDMSQKEAIEDFSNKYYSTIPHEFGRNRPPAIDNNELLRSEIAMLDTLTDMEVANQIMKTTGDKEKDAENVNLLDKRFQELNMEEMTPLDHKSSEYKALADYLIKSSGTSHGIRYRLEDIFRIDRKCEADRFAKSQYAKIHKKDKRLLWHGSRTTNYGGILSQGLRIAPPEAPVNGYAFGKVKNSPRLLPPSPGHAQITDAIHIPGRLPSRRLQQVGPVLRRRHVRRHRPLTPLRGRARQAHVRDPDGRFRRAGEGEAARRHCDAGRGPYGAAGVDGWGAHP